MREISYSLELLETMLEEFNDFLLSKETFWPLGSSSQLGGSFPRLSLGQFLLTRDELRVQAEEMEPEQVEVYSQLEERWQEIRSDRPANLEQKALAEMSQRLNLWKSYVQDLRETSQGRESYPTDVRHRVLLSRLRPFVDDEEIKSVEETVRQIDSRLRPIFRGGSFVWHPRLMPLYDEQEYWFLYGRPTPRG